MDAEGQADSWADDAALADNAAAILNEAHQLRGCRDGRIDELRRRFPIEGSTTTTP